jgi:hypothetical protein
MTATTKRLTLGVQEEFHLVDRITRRLTPRATDVLDGLSASARTFAAELQQTVVETNTDVVDTLDGLRQNLVELRSELAAAAEPLGIGIATAGTMPISLPDVPMNRLLMTTPTSNDSDWPKQTRLTDETVNAIQKELADHPYYDGTPDHIAPVLIWASALTAIQSGAGSSPSLLAAISGDLGDAYATLHGRFKTRTRPTRAPWSATRSCFLRSPATRAFSRPP